MAPSHHRHHQGPFGGDSPFFSRDEKGCKQLLETNIYFNIFPWQAAHQSQMNLGVYGLDVAFPARLQPAVMGAYCQISRI